MCEPARLPLENPIVQARLAEYREAMLAHQEFRQSQRDEAG